MLRVEVHDAYGQVIIARVDTIELAYKLINSIKDVVSYTLTSERSPNNG